MVTTGVIVRQGTWVISKLVPDPVYALVHECTPGMENNGIAIMDTARKTGSIVGRIGGSVFRRTADEPVCDICGEPAPEGLVAMLDFILA